MKKTSSAEMHSNVCHREDDVVGRGDPAGLPVAALEGAARQRGASSAVEPTLSLRSSAATRNGDLAGLLRHDVPRNDKSSLTLWLWVSVGFLLLLIAWVVLFTVARSAKIESVPRTTRGGRP